MLFLSLTSCLAPQLSRESCRGAAPAAMLRLERGADVLDSVEFGVRTAKTGNQTMTDTSVRELLAALHIQVI